MEQIKTTLRNLRKKNKYTQSSIAFKLGISTRAYVKIETGETNLSIARLRKIAYLFNVSLTELLTELPEENNSKSCVANESVSLLKHYEETILLLKEQNEILKKLLLK